MSAWNSLRATPLQHDKRPRGLEASIAAVAISEEPLTLQEIKEHLRISHNDDLHLLERLRTGVREMAERITRRLFVRRQVVVEWDVFYRQASLPYAPHGAIAEVARVDRDGAQVLTEGDDYYTRGMKSKRLYVSQQGSITTGFRDNGLRVTYEAGYETLPEALRLQMLRDIATRYEHRESITATAMERLPDTNAYDQWRDLSR